MPLDSLGDLDCDAVYPAIIEELLGQGELRQQATLEAALGMDQRAAVMAAGLIAAAGASLHRPHIRIGRGPQRGQCVD